MCCQIFAFSRAKGPRAVILVGSAILPLFWIYYILTASPEHKKEHPPTHSTYLQGESCQLFSKVILDNAAHVKFDTIRCAWQHPRKSLPDAEEFKNWKYFSRKYFWQISQILL